MSCTKTILASDRFVGLRKEMPSDHLARSHSSKDSYATAYSHLISTGPSKCNNFIKKGGRNPYSQVKHAPNLVLPCPTARMVERGVKVLEATKTLSAPNVRNNFYYSLLDVNPQGQFLIGTQDGAFIHQQSPGLTVNLTGNSPGSSTCSLKFSQSGELAYRGSDLGQLSIYDTEEGLKLRESPIHVNEIECIEPAEPWGLLTGSKDLTINRIDVRQKRLLTMKFIAHVAPICGISVRDFQVASGSADGQVLLWDLRKAEKLKTINMHQAAVKAIDWCPWKRHLLGSGGGSADHKIVLYDTEKDSVEEIIEGESQVTGLVWRQESHDLVTSHGGSDGFAYGMVWNYPDKEFSHVLKGHHSRITGLCVNSGNPEQVTTLSADETMRIWSVPLNRSSHRSKTLPRESSKLRDPILKW